MSRVVVLALFAWLAAGPAAADVVEAPPIGGQIAAAVLTAEDGHPFDLRTVFGRRPVVLAPVYFKCPNICDVGVAHLLQVLADAHLATGRDLDVVVVSFDATESVADAATFAAHVRGEVAAMGVTPLHFLTGSSRAVQELFASLGVTYARDTTRGEFVHPAIAAVLTPEGRVTSWLSTLSLTDDDLRRAVAAAHAGRSLSLSEIIIVCLHGGAPDDARTWQVVLALRFAAGVTVLLLATGLIRHRQRAERKRL